MRLRICLVAILSIVTLSLHAQDKIYKKDGGVISAKVKSVGSTMVIYKRFDNPDGPEYTILKKDVNQIKYENGTTDNFKGEDTKEGHQGYAKGGSKKAKFVKKYGDNILSVTPGAYTVSIDGTINDVGIGFCYERQLDERGHISFNLPVMVSFSSSKDFTNNSFYYNSNNNGTYTASASYHSYYFMPGVKFYPATSKEKVRYSLGASFFAIFGSEPYWVYDNGNNYATGTNLGGDWKYAVYGFMLFNSVNIAASKHLLMTIDLGLGIPVSDNRRTNNDNGLDVIFAPWIQFGFKVGYRF